MQPRLWLILCVAIVSFTLTGRAQNSPPIPFLGFPVDVETPKADRALGTYLRDNLKRDLEYRQDYLTYEHLVDDLAKRSGEGQPYIARVTPYVFVAARMLGAQFQPVGTYVSTQSDRGMTYRSYFAVRDDRFPFPRTLDGIKEFIDHRSKASDPVKFAYHSEFSTSSYFVPALWFRGQRIFDAVDSTRTEVTHIQTQRDGASSSALLQLVAGGTYDLAAVWDVTKRAWERGQSESGAKVVFIPLPNLLPNDLLIVSNAIGNDTKNELTRALEGMKGGHIKIGDFDSWMPVDKAPDAIQALAALERLAMAPPAPVVVRVVTVGDAREYQSEIEQAVRLAGTEFVLEVAQVHKAHDVIWTVEKVHDGAVTLSTAMSDDKIEDANQRFQLSFIPAAKGDLTRRVVSLIHSRMHRIRYIWPYKSNAPTVIRNVDFSIPNGAQLQISRIAWTNPDTNSFTPDYSFVSRVQTADDYKVTFDVTPFRNPSGATDFQKPLSNAAYRVVLRRESVETLSSKVLTATFVGLLALVAVGAGFDLRRRVRPQVAAAKATLSSVCAARAAAVHQLWFGKPLREADIIWCARDRLETLIANYKQTGLVPPALSAVKVTKSLVRVSASIPLVRGVVAGYADVSSEYQLTINPKDVGDPIRLNALLDVAIRKRLMSSFAGSPLEWEVLNELAFDVLEMPRADAARLVNAENPNVIDIVSRHFSEVIDDGKTRACFFPGTWDTITEQGRAYGRQRVQLPGRLWHGHDRVAVNALVLEFDLPNDLLNEKRYEGWLFGMIVRTAVIQSADDSALCLHFRPIALISSDVVPATGARTTDRIADREV